LIVLSEWIEWASRSDGAYSVAHASAPEVRTAAETSPLGGAERS
jgi:hypothetical protein